MLKGMLGLKEIPIVTENEAEATCRWSGRPFLPPGPRSFHNQSSGISRGKRIGSGWKNSARSISAPEKRELPGVENFFVTQNSPFSINIRKNLEKSPEIRPFWKIL